MATRDVRFAPVPTPPRLLLEQDTPDDPVWLPAGLASGIVAMPDHVHAGLQFENARTDDLDCLSELDDCPITYVGFDRCDLSSSKMPLVWRLSGLRQIDFDGCALHGPMLMGAAQARTVREIHLLRCRCDSTVFDAVPSLPQVHALTVTDGPLPPTRLDVLTRLPDLQHLILSRTDTTDADVRRVAALSKLVTLWLDETHVTDDGVECLQQVRGLRHLFLMQTAVTADAVMRLAAALPECTIDWGNETTFQQEMA